MPDAAIDAGPGSAATFAAAACRAGAAASSSSLSLSESPSSATAAFAAAGRRVELAFDEAGRALRGDEHEQRDRQPQPEVAQRAALALAPPQLEHQRRDARGEPERAGAREQADDHEFASIAHTRRARRERHAASALGVTFKASGRTQWRIGATIRRTKPGRGAAVAMETPLAEKARESRGAGVSAADAFAAQTPRAAIPSQRRPSPGLRRQLVAGGRAHHGQLVVGHVDRDVAEQRRAQIPLTRIGQHAQHDGAGGRVGADLQRAGEGRAAGRADEDAFLLGKLAAPVHGVGAARSAGCAR